MIACTMPSNAAIFLGIMLGFLLGVAGSTFFVTPVFVKYLFVASGIMIMAAGYKNRKHWLAVCFIAAFLAGIYRVEQALVMVQSRGEQDYQGIAYIERIEPKEGYQQIIVSLEDPDTGYFNQREKVLINVPSAPAYFYGRQVNVKCKLKNPENKYEKFNYIRYLAKDNIYQVCDRPQIKILAASQEKPLTILKKLQKYFFTLVFQTAAILEARIYYLYPQPEGAYMAGLLLGGSSRLPKEVQDYFKRTGTTHTVAVSGSNIAILADFLMAAGIAAGLWRQQAFWFSVVGILFFILLIGMPASAVRAAIMGTLLLWAIKSGRITDSVRAIILAATIMVAVSPLLLFYDAGFQLSFLATLGIVLTYGPFSKFFAIEKDFMQLKSVLLVTVCAQLGVFGLMLYTFEGFSPISFLANIIILPLVPLIMLGGFCTILASFISLGLAKFTSLPVWYLLHFEIGVIKYLAGFSWSMLDIQGLGMLWMASYYLFFVLLAIKYKKDSIIRRPG